MYEPAKKGQIAREKVGGSDRADDQSTTESFVVDAWVKVYSRTQKKRMRGRIVEVADKNKTRSWGEVIPDGQEGQA